MSRRTAVLASIIALALGVFATAAAASEPYWTEGPGITQSGNQVIGSNGSWLSYSGDVTHYIFRFTRNGVLVKGPESVPKTSPGEGPLPAGVYPDDPTANVYDLKPEDAGGQICVEVWGGHRSIYHTSDGALAFDAWEWGHLSLLQEPAKKCLTAPGSPPASPSPPAAPAPQLPIAPTATLAPHVSGFAMVEERLTATRGQWSGTAPLTVALEWQRCDADGGSCEGLGVAGDTYTVIRYDAGRTLRVKITASNAHGVQVVYSEPTAVVTELRPTEDRPWLNAAQVLAPHKLRIDQASVSPRRLVRRGAVQLTLRVSDSRSFRIQGALVRATALPGGALRVPVQAETDEEGLVTLTLMPGKKLTIRPGKSLTLVLNARRPGDKLTSPRGSTLRVKVPLGRAKIARTR